MPRITGAFPSNLFEHVAYPSMKPVDADFDWERVLTQVRYPICKEQEGGYQRYDWETDGLAEWHPVPVGGIVIIEGVYSIRKELADYYDFTVWVGGTD